MELKDRTIRKFKDINNNEYKIRQKKNRHYYLIIRENGKKVRRSKMTDKQKEAKKTLKTMKENIDKKYLKSRNSVAIETVLNLIQTQQAEIDSLKDFKEIAESKVTDLNPIGLARTNQLLSRQCHKLQEENEKKDKIIDLMSEQLTTPLHSKEWVKDYYERKVKDEN